MINGHCVQIIPWTGYIKTIFKRARVNQNIYMSCHESFHTPEQNSQLNCTKKKKLRYQTLQIESRLPFLRNIHKTDENSPLIFQKEQF